MKRTRMKHKTPKYQTLPAWKVERREWGESMKFCWLCFGKEHLTTHEMASKGQADEACAFLGNYARLCQPCHDRIQLTTSLAVALMLSRKKEFDLANYDRAAVVGLLRIHVTEQEVDWWVKVLKGR